MVRESAAHLSVHVDQQGHQQSAQLPSGRPRGRGVLEVRYAISVRYKEIKGGGGGRRRKEEEGGSKEKEGGGGRGGVSVLRGCEGAREDTGGVEARDVKGVG